MPKGVWWKLEKRLAVEEWIIKNPYTVQLSAGEDMNKLMKVTGKSKQQIQDFIRSWKKKVKV